MRVLVVASVNKGYYAPFIPEQCEALRCLGVECEMFGVIGNGARGYLRNLRRLREAIERFRPDVIHAHYGLCGLLANLQRRVPVVTTYHGSDINEPSVLPFSRVAMRLSAWNVFVSEKTMRIALGRCSGSDETCFGTDGLGGTADGACSGSADAAGRVCSGSAAAAFGACSSSADAAGRVRSGSDAAATGVCPGPGSAAADVCSGSGSAAFGACSGSADAADGVRSGSAVGSGVRRRSSLIPCGVNLEDLPVVDCAEARRRMGLKEDGRYVLFAGAFANPVKNSQLAFDAVACLNSAAGSASGSVVGSSACCADGSVVGSSACLNSVAGSAVCCGDGSASGSSAGSSACSVVGGRVELLELKGYSREQVTLLMNAADALIMTSLSEGSPQVVKEAMAVGCPVVSVDVGAVAELLDGLENCRIVPRTPEALASGLAEVMGKRLSSGSETPGSETHGSEAPGSEISGSETPGRRRLICLGLTNDLIAKRLLGIYEKMLL